MIRNTEGPGPSDYVWHTSSGRPVPRGTFKRPYTGPPHGGRKIELEHLIHAIRGVEGF